MLSSVSHTVGSKRQRLMIISVDESIIDQLEKTGNLSVVEQIVLPSQDVNSEKSDQQSPFQSSDKKNKPKEAPLICVICGSPAKGYNFGAIACEGCKAFFRRNARKESTAFHCTGQGDCKITSATRRFCSACRLTKCFNNGMQCDRILTAEQQAEKRRRIEENRKLALTSNSQPDEEGLLLSSSLSSDDLLASMDTNIFCTDFTDLLSPQPQPTLLSADDLQRIETISQLYEKRIEFAARDGLPWDPSMHTKRFIEVLNSHSVQVMRLLSFFKQIPEFNQLNVDDKVALIKSNLITLLGINSVLSYKTETCELVEDDSDVPSNLQFYPILHGYQTCNQLRKVFVSLIDLGKYDRKIIQFTLIILLLTQGFSMAGDYDKQVLNDRMSVNHAHNYYTELLWKYMETTYGHRKAIQLFSELIAHVTSWQTLHDRMENNILRALSPDDTNELLPIMKSVLRVS